MEFDKVELLKSLSLSEKRILEIDGEISILRRDFETAKARFQNAVTPLTEERNLIVSGLRELAVATTAIVVKSEESPANLNKILLRTIEELGLTVRAFNALKNDNLYYIGDVVQKTERELINTPDLGKKLVQEIKTALGGKGLTLGMVLDAWPPEWSQKAP